MGGRGRGISDGEGSRVAVGDKAIEIKKRCETPYGAYMAMYSHK